jgi:hypothetical protein
MKITIDTKEDSHEDIKKVLNLLHHLTKNKEVEIINNEQATNADSNSGFMNMFSDNTIEEKKGVERVANTDIMNMFSEPINDAESIEQKKEISETEGSAPDFSSFTNLVDKKEDKEEDKIKFF